MPEPKEAPPPPRTLNEQSHQRYELAHPLHEAFQKVGISGLSAPELQLWTSAQYCRATAASSGTAHKKQQQQLGNKAHRETWRTFNEASLPLRVPKKPTCWGKDFAGRDVGELSLDQFRARFEKRARLTCLLAARGTSSPQSEPELIKEKRRRLEMATLRSELYGELVGSLARDPAWDDVVPIPLNEPDNALAAIAYPDDYAEGMLCRGLGVQGSRRSERHDADSLLLSVAISYLRAVMASKEYSPRCLNLTEHIISMNPAHYTVWLYRFSIIKALGLAIPDEIQWLNSVALQHLKNYQIWHHRHLLIDNYYPKIADDKEQVARLATSERDFITTMLAEDTKNYHVWSYRQFLVRRLQAWRDPEERRAVEGLIDDDVRNNSAWSHRFFLVFTDPEQTTAGSHATEADLAVPAAVIDEELAYAKAKIDLAPQNQSPWNYLRGVLVKGGRKLASVEEFASGFVADLGDAEKEEVRSTHALDLLAEIYAEKGDKDKAALCLDRLGDEWDRIRKGYWDWRKKTLTTAV